MIYKTNVTDKTVCIGSFAPDTEVVGQFQYAGKKGNVYMFYINAISDAGLSIANVVTGELSTIDIGVVKKIKALDGPIVSVNKYASVDRMDLTKAIVNGDEFACVNSEYTDIKVVGMSVVNKVAKFMLEDSTEYPVEQMYTFVETVQFG